MTKETKAHGLLRRLGLTVVKHGAGGRYPCAEPGPATGYRYWSTYTEGQYKFGVQAVPKKTLTATLQHQTRAAGFDLTPKRWEAFLWLGPTEEAAFERARAAMSTLEKILA